MTSSIPITGVAFVIDDSQLQVQEFKLLLNRLATSNKRQQTWYHSRVGLSAILDICLASRKSNATFLNFWASREAVPNSDYFIVASILRLDDDVTRRLKYEINS
ncbi:hypothetical protein ACTXT7_007749 [Hymenolepis weldensis]